MFDCMGYKVKTKLIVKNNKKGRLIAILKIAISK